MRAHGLTLIAGRLRRLCGIGNPDPLSDPQGCESALVEAREANITRVAKAELAAVDADFLKALAGLDSRRLRLSLTLVGDHAYVDCEGQSFDGPLTRASL